MLIPIESYSICDFPGRSGPPVLLSLYPLMYTLDISCPDQGSVHYDGF